MRRTLHLIDDTNPGGVKTNLDGLLASRTLQGRQSVIAVNSKSPFGSYSLRAENIVIHFSIAWAKLPFLFLLRALNPRAQLILQEHHYTPEHFALSNKSTYRFERLMRITGWLFDRFLAVSQQQARWYRTMGVEVHCVISPLAQLSQLFEVPSKDKLETPVVGVSGRLNTAKGIDTVLQLIEQPEASSFSFVIAGFGELESDVKDAARRHSNVRFLGKYDCAKSYLSECDLVLVPSRLDSFGLTALEAKAAAKPIVVTTTGGLADQATGCGVAVSPACPRALCNGIHKLINHSDLRALGDVGRRQAQAHNSNVLKLWSQQLCAQQLLET